MYEQIELPYSFDVLEPHIDALTMEIHADQIGRASCRERV